MSAWRKHCSLCWVFFFLKKQKLMNNHQKPHLFHTPLYSFNDHLWPRSQPPELYYTTGYSGFPNDSAGKESACNAGDTGDTGSVPWIEKIPWRRKWQPAPVFLPVESHGWRSLAGYSPKGHTESDTTERLSVYLHTHIYVHLDFC